jgi:hypothetical protein
MSACMLETGLIDADFKIQLRLRQTSFYNNRIILAWKMLKCQSTHIICMSMGRIYGFSLVG